MIAKCFKCGEPGHRSCDCMRQKSVNLIKRQYELEAFDDEGELCKLNRGDKENLYKHDDDDERKLCG